MASSLYPTSVQNKNQEEGSFADQLESYIRGLEAFGITSNSYGRLFICFLIDKLAVNVRRHLTLHQGKADWSPDELKDSRREI